VFDFLKKKPATKVSPMRDTLFGDAPLADWTNVSPAALALEPWSSFLRARQFLETEDSPRAVEVLKEIVAMPDLESRHYLQAWQSLRDLGTNPPSADAKNLLGVVVEVGMPDGVDLVAAYADHHARYYNYSGAAVIWDSPDTSLDADIDALLAAGRVVVQAIGPWEGSRPAAPKNGIARINLLTPSGLNFGEGPMDALTKDKLGGPVINAALQLMLELMNKTKK
jgi:hypothetical protein